MAISVVQIAPLYQNGSITSGAVTFGSPITAGNVIVFLTGNVNSPNSLPASITVTDTLLNSYGMPVRADLAPSDFGVFMWTAMFFAKSPAGGADTVSVVVPGGQTISFAMAMEVAGLDASPLDTAGATATGNGTTSSVTITTAAAKSIVVAVTQTGFFAGAFTPDPAYALIGQADSAGNFSLGEYRIVSSAGSETPTATFTPADNWQMSAMALKAPSAASDCNFFGMD